MTPCRPIRQRQRPIPPGTAISGARRALAALALVALATACKYAGGVRPRHGALPQSELVNSARPAFPLIEELAAALQAAGLSVERASAREGYLETRWFDVTTRASTSPPFSNLDRVVKMRFFADDMQGRTRLLAECVQRVTWDPSVPQRELERMVPDGHPGRVLMDSVLAPFVLADTTRPGPPIGPPIRP